MIKSFDGDHEYVTNEAKKLSLKNDGFVDIKKFAKVLAIDPELEVADVVKMMYSLVVDNKRPNEINIKKFEKNFVSFVSKKGWT